MQVSEMSMAIEMAAILDHIKQARERLEHMRSHAPLPWDSYSWWMVLKVLEKWAGGLVDRYRGAAVEESGDSLAGEILR